MEEYERTARDRLALKLLGPLFFVSGATGLVWQGLWGRQLHLVFGTSTFAIATVLSAFMAGLALGGWAIAKRVSTIQRPLQVYGALELIIGAWAFVFPWMLQGIEPIYLAFWRSWEPGPVAYGMVQFLLVGSALVVPTAAMGATLPLLARFASDSQENSGDRIGWLYSTNTAGAVVGTFLCGFVMLPGLGLWWTTVLTAVANMVLGGVAVALGAQVQATPDAPVAAITRPAPRGVLTAVALAGFASLLYEVAYFRVLGLTLGASVYAFSVMLLAFLVGIAAGGRWGGPWADRLHEAGGTPRVLAALGAVEIGVGVAAWGVMYAFQELPYWYVWGFDLFNGDRSATGLWIMSCVLAGLVLLAPTLLMGVAFPLAVRAVVGSDGEVGADVGRVYAANTAGGVPGAALAGFVLLPWLEVRGTIALGVVVNVLAAAAAVSAVPAGSEERSRATRRLGGVVAAVALISAVLPPPWDPMMMTSGMYKYVTDLSDHSREGIRSFASRQYDMLYYREGLSSVVTVARNQDTGNIWLANNGKIDASTTYDMPTQVLVSLLPFQFVDRADDVLVIGLASGITAGAVTLVDEVGQLDVVELEPAIVEAARFFDEHNHHLLDDPRTRLILNDGRNHVLLTPPGTYDIIVSEPSNPWLTGVSNLFTDEFFRMGKERLKPGGIWSQWVQLYGMDESDLRSLVKTFVGVYPHVLVYTAAESADLVLLGSDRELVPSVEAVNRMLARPKVKAELDIIELGEPGAIYGHLLLDRERALALAGDAELNTDDNLRIEYNAPLHLHTDTQSINVELLRRHAWLPLEHLGHDAALLQRASRHWLALDEFDRAIDGLTRAALMLPEEDLTRQEWLEDAFAWFVKQRTDKAAASVERGLLEVLRQDFWTEVVDPIQAGQPAR